MDNQPQVKNATVSPSNCSRKIFIRHYSYRGYLGKVEHQIADMAVNGSGIHDTARMLGISPTTVIEELEKPSNWCLLTKPSCND